MFEKKLLKAGLLDQASVEQIHEEALAEVEAAVEQVLGEPQPRPEDIERLTRAVAEF